ncbi:DDE_3 domain-containing protein [Trichonephila clavipes]|nr:DDE_3 domain-containing protein [Trichonephila clavipes]
MRWRIVGRTEAGQFQTQICRKFNLTTIVKFNLWKKFQDIGFLKGNPEQVAVTAVKYNEDVLEPYDLFLRDANPRSDIAYLLIEFLKSEDICQMDWITRSPDLKPRGMPWAITTHNASPRTI